MSSWSQKLSPLCRCTKCSMLSVLSFNSPAIKLLSKKAHVGTFKEGTAFLGSDLGLRVLDMNLGAFKTEWTVLGPWSLDFCMVSTLSINTEMCAWRSMLTTSLGWTPQSSFFTQGCCSWTHLAWFRPRSVGKQQFYWKTVYREVWFLKFCVSKFSSPRRIKKEEGARCSMLTALFPPIHRDMAFLPKSPGCMEFPQGDLPFMRPKQ